jgi:hypothetical protein
MTTLVLVGKPGLFHFVAKYQILIRMRESTEFEYTQTGVLVNRSNHIMHITV